MGIGTTDEELREALDGDGVLRPGVLPSPSAGAALVVFAQRDDARFEDDAWRRSAERFFATKLGLAHDKRYGELLPREDAAAFVVAPANEAPGVRVCFARPRTDEDLERARDAVDPGGLAMLAARCRYVFLVEAHGDDDRLALRLAAIAASVLLGPILPPSGRELFGVKTARIRLGV